MMAEKAEEERRAVLQRAKPFAEAAEVHQREASILKQQAAETEFHAQVLENRARALIREGEEMARLSISKAAEGEQVMAQLEVAHQEIEEMKMQIDNQPARSLPQYIDECHREIGALQSRINQLREEVAWAEEEIVRAREESDTWRRIVVSREALAAKILLQISQLNKDSETARSRSVAAAEEAHQPMELAEKKYEEAWTTAQKAEQEKAKAKQAEEAASKIKKGTVGPESERQKSLREAAEAESVAKKVEAKVGDIQEDLDTKIEAAEAKAETATELKEESREAEKEMEVEKEIMEAEESKVKGLHAEAKAHPTTETASF